MELHSSFWRRCGRYHGYAFFGLAYVLSLGLEALLERNAPTQSVTLLAVVAVAQVAVMLFFAVAPSLWPTWAEPWWRWVALGVPAALSLGATVAAAVHHRSARWGRSAN